MSDFTIAKPAPNCSAAYGRLLGLYLLRQFQRASHRTNNWHHLSADQKERLCQQHTPLVPSHCSKLRGLHKHGHGCYSRSNAAWHMKTSGAPGRCPPQLKHRRHEHNRLSLPPCRLANQAPNQVSTSKNKFTECCKAHSRRRGPLRSSPRRFAFACVAAFVCVCLYAQTA